jgi:acyl-CoA synthetase (NDP forming)
VDDAHQRRGLASVLLEHLAAIATERGIRQFEAEVLLDNLRMARIFTEAGYQTTGSYEADSVHYVFPIEHTAASLAVVQSREQRAEARSIARLLTPGSVAVIGASRTGSVGHAVLINLLRSDFRGPVYPVNPHAHHVAGVRAYPTVGEVPDDIDLAILAIPAPAVADVVAQCADKGVRGLVVMSDGFSDMGPAGLAAERALVTTARANGMRVIGPNCLGVLSTAPEVSLNATVVSALPRRGRAGFFTQSWAIGAAVLESTGLRGLGLSTFISAGNQADVSSNDLLQYWEDDPATDVVLLHIESFGNARKFARLARRLGRRKPIVAVKGGRAVAARLDQAADPERAVDALFRQAGVIRVDTLAQLFDVAQVLTTQPLPTGRCAAIVANSAALGRLTADSCIGNGLELRPLSPATLESLRPTLEPTLVNGNPVILARDCGPADFGSVLAAVIADAAVDAVVTVVIPPLSESDTDMAEALATASTGNTKPLVCIRMGYEGSAAARRDDPGAVLSFPSPDVAVAALARAAAYAEWRRRPEGTVPILPDVEKDAARTMVADTLRASPAGGPLATDQVDRLLAMYGVRLWPAIPVTSVDEAVAAAADLGYPVALKATVEPLRHRPELGTVRLDITDGSELRAAYQAMTGRLGTEAGLAVQAMAPPGVATVIHTVEDPAFGALVSFGLGGVATDLLGDHGFRILPLTDLDAAELVRSVRAAPLLFGYRGSDPVDVAALEQLLLRVARLADDLPEIAELELNPVIVAPSGTYVLGATARVAVPATRLDSGPRRMR